MRTSAFSFLAALVMLGSLRGGTQQGQAAPAEQQITTPSYHDSAPAAKLQPVLSPSHFKNAFTRNAYMAAGKIPDILYQMPCYCYCDRANGHKSLHDCFTSKHAASCSVCEREAIYAYEQHAGGKTAAQIRKGVMSADWADLDTSKYEKQLIH
jgi:hypothetical protein